MPVSSENCILSHMNNPHLNTPVPLATRCLHAFFVDKTNGTPLQAHLSRAKSHRRTFAIVDRRPRVSQTLSS